MAFIAIYKCTNVLSRFSFIPQKVPEVSGYAQRGESGRSRVPILTLMAV